MVKVLVTDGMEKSAVEALKSKGYDVEEQFYPIEELMEKIADVDVIVVRSATKVRKELIDRMVKENSTKLIIRGGVGVDNIDVDYAQLNGIQVNNTPNASSDSVAEYVLGSMFALTRHIHDANVTMRRGEWNKKQYKGNEINGSVLGLIGFGRIAKCLAKKAEALGMKVIYTDVTGEQQGYPQYQFKPLNELLAEADFVSLHASGAKEVIMGKEQFAQMKNTAYFINSSRGALVDTDAMLDALNADEIKGCALDVFEKEPLVDERISECLKICLTPHIGGATVEAQTRIGNEIVEIIEDFYNKTK